MKEPLKNLVYDQWLAHILAQDVYRLIVDDVLVEMIGNKKVTAYDLLEGSSARPAFIYTKVPTESLIAIKLLERLGFNLVETSVVLDKPVLPCLDFAGYCVLRFAKPEDQNQVVELARKSFLYTRFHLDNTIPREGANMIKAEWVRNYFLGQRGQQMVVALVGEMIVGFLQLLYNSNRTLRIDLIAVDKDQRRKGVARDMITYAEAECGEFERIQVGTQIANITSLRLYEKIGFRITDAQYVFHYHTS